MDGRALALLVGRGFASCTGAGGPGQDDAAGPWCGVEAWPLRRERVLEAVQRHILEPSSWGFE